MITPARNFKTEEENRKYIEDNILYHHPKTRWVNLPSERTRQLMWQR